MFQLIRSQLTSYSLNLMNPYPLLFPAESLLICVMATSPNCSKYSFNSLSLIFQGNPETMRSAKSGQESRACWERRRGYLASTDGGLVYRIANYIENVVWNDGLIIPVQRLKISNFFDLVIDGVSSTSISVLRLLSMNKNTETLDEKSGQYRGPRQNFVLTVFFLCPL